MLAITTRNARERNTRHSYRASLRSLAAAALLLILPLPVLGHANGYLTCIDAVGAGHTVTSFGTGGAPWYFTLLQSGVQVSRYVGGQTYTLQVAPVSGVGLGGFIISGFKGTPTSVGTRFTAAAKAGVLQPTADGLAQQMQPPGCQTGVTHTTADLKTLVTLTWTAPTAGTGNVTFFGILLADNNSPSYRVYLLVPEGVAASSSSTATPTASLAAASSTPSLSAASTSTPASTASATAAATTSGTATTTQSGTSAATASASTTTTASTTGTAASSVTGTAAASATASSTTTSVATASATASTTPSTTTTTTCSPSGTGTSTWSSTATTTASPTRSSTWTPSGTTSPSSTASSRMTSSPTLSMGASASGTATGTGSASRTATPSSSRSGTASSSRTNSPSPSRTGTRSASRTGTPSSSRSGTVSTSRTSTPSASRSGNATRSATPSTTASAAGSLSASLTSTMTSTSTGTPSQSPQTPSPSPSASLVSLSGTPSATATMTATMSPTPMSASPPPGSASASATASHASLSVSATSSPHGTPPASTVGPANGGAYTHSLALDSVLLLRWTLHAAIGAVDFQLQATGSRWISLAPSPGHTDMVHGGVAIVGTPGDGKVQATLMRSQLQADLLWDPALLAVGTTNATVAYDAGLSVTRMSWTRALAGSGAPGDVDLSPLLSTPALFIWGYGYPGAAWSQHQGRGAAAVLLYPEGCNRNATCHGRGECAAAGAGATCACDIGYSASDACASCAPMFSPTTAWTTAKPTCSLLDSTLVVGGFSLSVFVGLIPVYATVGDVAAGASWATANDLAAALAAEVAAATSMDPALVTVRIGALSGSAPLASAANATVIFAAPPRGRDAATNTTVVDAAFRALIAALGDVNSDLRNGPAGMGLNPAVAPVVAPVFVPLVDQGPAPAPAAPYTANLLTPDGITTTLTWYLEDEGGTRLGPGAGVAAVAAAWLHGELAFPGDAWFGVGFGHSAAMVPADGIACEPPLLTTTFAGAIPPPGAVHTVLLGGYVAAACPTLAPAAVPPANSTPAGIAVAVLDTPTSVTVLAPGGGAVCRFRRRVAAGAAIALGSVPGSITPRNIADNGRVYLTFAHGAPGVRGLSSHAARHAGAVIVDFVTGDVRPLPPPPNYAAFTAHAIAGVAALLVLLPASVIAARYYRFVGAATPHSAGHRAVWFRAQALSLIVAVAAALATLALGLASTESRAAASGDAAAAKHFTDAHGILGLIAVVLLVLLPAAACTTPHAKAWQYAAAMRNALAAGAFVVGVAAAMTGIYSAPLTDSVSTISFVLVATWVALVAGTFAAHELRARQRHGQLLTAVAPGGVHAKGRIAMAPFAAPSSSTVAPGATAPTSVAGHHLDPTALHHNPMPSVRQVKNPLVASPPARR